MHALIIVDVQYDFLPGGALAVTEGDTIIPVINGLQENYELVVATQDRHPDDHRSFASAHPDRQPFDIIDLEGLEQTLWPNHCIQGTTGAMLSPQLDTRRIEAIFRKGTDPLIDSYSGFFDNGRRKQTGMASYLKSHGVTAVSVCGLAADYCVYFTAMDALELGFSTDIVADAVKPIDASAYTVKQQLFVEQGGKLITSRPPKPNKLQG